jgi:hypothetical protein
MNRIDKDLPNHICKKCGNLTYWDGYICKEKIHTTKLGFLNMRKLKYCTHFKIRKGLNFDECKNIECVFWCNDCEMFQKLYKDIDFYK